MIYQALTIIFALVGQTAAFVKPAGSARSDFRVYENFGLDFAESQVENSPAELLGEANYKRFVSQYDNEALINSEGDAFYDGVSLILFSLDTSHFFRIDQILISRYQIIFHPSHTSKPLLRAFV
jgi:hypothetical protein